MDPFSGPEFCREVLRRLGREKSNFCLFILQSLNSEKKQTTASVKT